jgi:subtilisin family serine protease
MRSYRVLGCDNRGPVSGIIAGINEATLHYTDEAVPRAGVVNMSLGVASGSYALDQSVQDTIDDAGYQSYGGLYPLTFVTSLGNENSGMCHSSPGGRVHDAISVGATDQSDARAYFGSGGASNFGPCLDVFAPGAHVRAASNVSDTGISFWSGTSFSAPLVSGVAAMYLHVHGYQTTPAEVEEFVIDNSENNMVSNPGQGSPNRFLNSRLY